MHSNLLHFRSLSSMMLISSSSVVTFIMFLIIMSLSSSSSSLLQVSHAFTIRSSSNNNYNKNNNRVVPVVVYSTQTSVLRASSTLESPPTTTTTTTTSSSKNSKNSNNNDDDDDDDIPLAPLTQWGEPYDDIVAIQQQAKQQILPEFSYEIDATKVLLPSRTSTGSTTTTTTTLEDIEINYLQQNRLDIIQKMQDHGCVIFRNFTLMTTPNGFTTFYNTLQMHVCCDPLHTVSARPTIATTSSSSTSTTTTKKSPIYEAVNKESRKNFFIGMHNEFVGTRAPAGAAFVCFNAAPNGGEFLIADARRIFQTIPSHLLQLLYQQQIRYSVIELPFFQFIDTMIIEPFREPIANVIKNIINFAMNQKVDFDIDLQWITNQESIYNSNNNNNNNNDNHNNSVMSQPQRILQARAPRQPPIIPHPITNDPVWFCNVHSHSAILRQQREAIYGAERFEDGASQINKSDMYFGNDEPLTVEQLRILDDVTNAQIKYVKMYPGDVVLLDNYKTLHGRNVFDGVRKHGVAWFEGWERS